MVGKYYKDFSPVDKQKVDNCEIDCKIYKETLSPNLIGEFFLQRQETKKTSFGEQLNAQTQSKVKKQMETLMRHDEFKLALSKVKNKGKRIGILVEAIDFV